MSSITKPLGVLFVKTASETCPAFPFYQSIRWWRKPRWLPVAPSKMFRIPVKRKIPEEEQIKIRTLYNNYKTSMKSLRSYFAAKTAQMTTSPSVLAEQKKLEEEDDLLCVKINEEWNQNIKIIRENRIKAEKEKEYEMMLQKIEEHEKMIVERKEYIESLVRMEKEKSKTFITSENIDEAIEKALSSSVDYEFSLDLEGNITKGRLTKPTHLDNKDDKQKIEMKS